MALSLGAAYLAVGCSIKPKPFTANELAHRGQFNVSRLAYAQDPIGKPIDLYEAMARALRYNLTYRVEVAQTSLRAAELNLAHYSLLPNAVASSGYLALLAVADNFKIAAISQAPVLLFRLQGPGIWIAKRPVAGDGCH